MRILLFVLDVVIVIKTRAGRASKVVSFRRTRSAESLDVATRSIWVLFLRNDRYAGCWQRVGMRLSRCMITSKINAIDSQLVWRRQIPIPGMFGTILFQLRTLIYGQIIFIDIFL